MGGSNPQVLDEEDDETIEETGTTTGFWKTWNPKLDLLPNNDAHEEYVIALRKQKINLWLLVPFMALTLAVVPIVLPPLVFRGDFGRHFQTISVGIALQLSLQYVVLALDLYRDEIASRFSVHSYIVCVWREWAMTIYCLFSPIGHGAIMYLRSTGEQCRPNATVLETNFCRSTEREDLSLPNYTTMMFYAVFYQILFPLPFRIHVLSWAIGLAFLLYTISEVYSRTQSDVGDNFVVSMLCYCACACIQVTLQQKTVRSFLLLSRGGELQSVAVALPRSDDDSASASSSMPPPPPQYTPPPSQSGDEWSAHSYNWKRTAESVPEGRLLKVGTFNSMVSDITDCS